MFMALAAVVVVVVGVQPFEHMQLGATTSFVPVMLALVACFDLACAMLLVGRFRDTGSARPLVLSWAYVFSLVVLLGWGAAFPGVFGSSPPLGGAASNAPWLWVLWHTAFPVLLGVGAAPWPRRWEATVSPERRRRLIWTTVFGSFAAGVLVVGGVVWAGERLPVVIHGLDTTRMTELAGPVMLPLIAAAVAVATVGAMRRGGPERWVAVAAAAALGDVVLTLFSSHRFSLGWYVGRTMTIVSSAVVLVALLTEFGAMRRRLTRLEALQRTLIEHVTGGVVMQDRAGEIVVYNSVAAEILSLEADPADRRVRVRDAVRIVRPDGSEWPLEDLPNRVTLRTGRPQPAQVVGFDVSPGTTRWVQIETAAALDQGGAVDFVVSTLNDVTERHTAAATRARVRLERLDAIDAMIVSDAIRTVFQPIVDLETLAVVGVEALSRFPGSPPRGPDVWFGEAATLGVGTRLELAALTAALKYLPDLDPELYVSLNVSPDTLLAPEFQAVLARHSHRRLVIELTEHVEIADYGPIYKAIGSLRESGIKVAVDDAGAGYASLRHILTLGPDIIKLDFALIRDIHEDPARQALTACLVAFGADVGTIIVAEGIETERELDTLRRLGVRFGQGYYLGKPEPLLRSRPRLALPIKRITPAPRRPVGHRPARHPRIAQSG